MANRLEHDAALGGRYRLVRRIAAGGMGTVWEGVDQVLHRPVAVKLPAEALAADEQFLERFRREARAAAGLTHPNVAAVFDYGEDLQDGQPIAYLVMELVDGETLSSRLSRRGRLEPDEARWIAAEVADALEAAHRAGLVHRDVKPANVMITGRGDVKVMDFGIAAAMSDTSLTQSGSLVGTASYLAPERLAGERGTPASDIYSLGVVLFEMLAGRPPFSGDTPVAVAHAHLSESLPNLEQEAPGTPPDLTAACRQALAKEPLERPASAAAFAEALRGSGASAAVLPGTDPTIPVGRPSPTDVIPIAPRSTRARRPVRWGWAAALVVLALLVGLFAWALVRSGATTPTGHPPPTSQVTSAPPATVPIPQVAGMKVEDAKKALTDAGLIAGPTVTVEGKDGVVVSTTPAIGEAVEPGTTVTLYVGGTHEGPGKHRGKGHD